MSQTFKFINQDAIGIGINQFVFLDKGINNIIQQKQDINLHSMENGSKDFFDMKINSFLMNQKDYLQDKETLNAKKNAIGQTFVIKHVQNNGKYSKTQRIDDAIDAANELDKNLTIADKQQKKDISDIISSNNIKNATLISFNKKQIIEEAPNALQQQSGKGKKKTRSKQERSNSNYMNRSNFKIYMSGNSQGMNMQKKHEFTDVEIRRNKNDIKKNSMDLISYNTDKANSNPPNRFLLFSGKQIDYPLIQNVPTNETVVSRWSQDQTTQLNEQTKQQFNFQIQKLQGIIKERGIEKNKKQKQLYEQYQLQIRNMEELQQQQQRHNLFVKQHNGQQIQGYAGQIGSQLGQVSIIGMPHQKQQNTNNQTNYQYFPHSHQYFERSDIISSSSPYESTAQLVENSALAMQSQIVPPNLIYKQKITKMHPLIRQQQQNYTLVKMISEKQERIRQDFEERLKNVMKPQQQQQLPLQGGEKGQEHSISQSMLNKSTCEPLQQAQPYLSISQKNKANEKVQKQLQNQREKCNNKYCFCKLLTINTAAVTNREQQLQLMQQQAQQQTIKNTLDDGSSHSKSPPHHLRPNNKRQNVRNQQFRSGIICLKDQDKVKLHNPNVGKLVQLQQFSDQALQLQVHVQTHFNYNQNQNAQQSQSQSQPQPSQIQNNNANIIQYKKNQLLINKAGMCVSWTLLNNSPESAGAGQLSKDVLQKYRNYVEFIQKVNFSNDCLVELPKSGFKPYRAFIGKGNNGQIVRNMLKQRWWWQLVESRHHANINTNTVNLQQQQGAIEVDKELNLVWTQIRQKDVLSWIKRNVGSAQPLKSAAELITYRQLNCEQEGGKVQEQEQKIELDSKSNFNEGQSQHQSQQNDQMLEQSFHLIGQNVMPDTLQRNQNEQPMPNQDQATATDETIPNTLNAVTLTSSKKKPPRNDDKTKSAIKARSSLELQKLANLKKLFYPNDLVLFESQRLLSYDLIRQKHNLPYEGFIQSLRALKPELNILSNLNCATATPVTPLRLHNHIPGNFNLNNKKALFYNIKLYCILSKLDPFDYIPVTFHLRDGKRDPEFQHFMAYYKAMEQRRVDYKRAYYKNHNNSVMNANNSNNINSSQIMKMSLTEYKRNKPRNIWIVKPGENTNRGRGIEVCEDLYEVTAAVGAPEWHSSGKSFTYILQHYVDKPLLYNRRKFDIRAYMLITCVNGHLKAYWYQEGYLRTTSKEFTLKNLQSRKIHLTNDAVQMKYQDYGKYESGNKLSYAEFQKYMEKQTDVKCDFMKDIYPQMKNSATLAVRAVYNQLSAQKVNNTFELFGLDFLIDQSCKVHLLEVNANPCLEMPCPILVRLIPNVIENSIKIAIDTMFPPPDLNYWGARNKANLPENIEDNNKFEIIFDEQVEGSQIKFLYTWMDDQTNYLREKLKETIDQSDMENEDENSSPQN